MRIRFLLSALLVLPSFVTAQTRDTTTVKLVVTPDHPDWLYNVGDTARFNVSLLRLGKPVPSARVRVSFGMERMPVTRVDTVDVSTGEHTLKGALPHPGFLRATATAVVDGATYTGMATAGFSPEKITSSLTMPADFQAFWAKAIAEARRTPLAPIMTRLPQYSTPDVDAYHISFQNQRAGSRIYGMLAVPTKPGKYPLMLVVPGAGVRPYFPGVSTAKRGVIRLDIGIHGIPVDRDSLLYNELRATALQQYYLYGAEDRDKYYYNRVIIAVLRAGDFLFSLPQADTSHYVVQGGSQGGGLSIIAGALDPRVKAIGVVHPAMSDQFGYFEGRPGGWPHMFQDTLHVSALTEKKETIRYYDVINFARLLKVPGFYTWGFNDNTVPPTSSFATYNTITAPKQKKLYPETGHFLVPPQREALDAFLFDALGVTTP
jgi:cephalosporin-C deacetylase-like acetyl esterase